MTIKACWLIASILTILLPTWTVLADHAKPPAQRKEKIEERKTAILESNMTGEEKLKAMQGLLKEVKESSKDVKLEEQGTAPHEANSKIEEESVEVIYSD